MAGYANENRRTMAQNIKRLMEEQGKTRREVCADLGIRYSTLTEWINGGKYPRIQNIEMLAQYFGVPKSVLVEDAQIRTPASDTEDRRLLAAYDRLRKDLTPDDIEDVVLFMTMLAQRRRKANAPREA